MVRARRAARADPPQPDLATLVAELQGQMLAQQRQMLEQQQEITRLREELAHQDQGPQVQEGPPPAQYVPPEVQPEAQPEIPIAPAGIPVHPLPVQEDLLYERFRRMKAPDFEGLADPTAADNWLIDIQVILEFMRLGEQEKVLCASFALKKNARHWWRTVQMRRDVAAMTWNDFVSEFRTMYYNREVLAVQQDAFTSFQQGSLTVMEAVEKFEQLARLCPTLVSDEEEKVRLMMKMFRTDIAMQVSAGHSSPTTVSDCIGRAIRAEYWINRNKEARAQIFKAKKEEKAAAKANQPRQGAGANSHGQNSNSDQNSGQTGRNKRKGNFTGQGTEENRTTYPTCATCGKKHLGVCRFGTNSCYVCGEEGHYARSCPQNNQTESPPHQNQNPNQQQLHTIQARIEGPSIAQGRLEGPEPQVRIYAYTDGNAEAGTSHSARD